MAWFVRVVDGQVVQVLQAVDGAVAPEGWLEVLGVPPRPDDTSVSGWEPEVSVVDGVASLVWVERPLTPVEKRANLGWKLVAAREVLRNWSVDAASTTVTAGNAVAVLQVVVTRFGFLCDRLADLVDVQLRAAGED